MIPYARDNKGYKYLLTVIDCFSKYAWAEPLKNKTAEEVTGAMERILKDNKSPKNIQSDLGKEFYNSKFKALMTKFDINHYSTYNSTKAAIVERFNRTLKSKMWKLFSLQGSYKYLNQMPKLLKEYNYTKHNTTGFRPVDITSKKIEDYLLQNVYSRSTKSQKPPKFNEGDVVRISKNKTVFSKGYTGNWSIELFTIHRLQNTIPVTYIIKDNKGQIIQGSFYEAELQKTLHPDIYLIEKVLKKKGNNLYVKYLGLEEKGWIKRRDVV